MTKSLRSIENTCKDLYLINYAAAGSTIDFYLLFIYPVQNLSQTMILLNNVVQRTLKEFFPHESNLLVFRPHPTEHFVSLVREVLVLDGVCREQSNRGKCKLSEGVNVGKL